MEDKELQQEENKSVSISARFFNVLFALIAAGLMIVLKILVDFGVNLGAAFGIFAIIIYACAAIGVVLNFLSSKKLTGEFWINFGVLLTAILVM
ncbi:MAG: hypothetical protein IK147_02855 [Clostridia bacterium]|nr:hypothetical protein [Clostridia bacterium]